MLSPSKIFVNLGFNQIRAKRGLLLKCYFIRYALLHLICIQYGLVFLRFIYPTIRQIKPCWKCADTVRNATISRWENADTYILLNHSFKCKDAKTVRNATTWRKENADITIRLNHKHTPPKVVPSSVPVVISAPNYNSQASLARYAGMENRVMA